MSLTSTSPTLVVRCFVVATMTATASLAGELFFVFGMKLFAHPVPFTSFFTVAMFAGSVGFLPTQPSPSRISSTPVSIAGRLLLLVETAIMVAIAIYASAEFMAFRRITMPIDLSVVACIYILILFVTLAVNFGRLRREISAN